MAASKTAEPTTPPAFDYDAEERAVKETADERHAREAKAELERTPTAEWLAEQERLTRELEAAELAKRPPPSNPRVAPAPPVEEK